MYFPLYPEADCHKRGVNRPKERQGRKGATHCEKRRLMPKAYEQYFDFVKYGMTTYYIFSIFLAVVRPHSPELISCLLLPLAEVKSSRILQIFVRVGSVLFQAHFLFIFSVSGHAWGFLAFSFVFCGTVLLRQIR